jgi:hypothetical protein
MATEKRNQTAKESTLPVVSKEQPSESGYPGGGQGRRDVTGHLPENIHVDPYITEGQEGYEDSGSSEIIPTERLTRGDTAEPESK